MSNVRGLGPQGLAKMVRSGRVVQKRASMQSWLRRLVAAEEDIKAGRKVIGTPGLIEGGGK